MAPEYNPNLDCFRSESPRQSPRIQNRIAAKFDVSTVNNKLSFMRSLNLCCNQNTLSNSKIDWEILMPRNKWPLRECSVVMNDVRCEICGVILKNQIDIDNHKNIHSRLLTDSDESKENCQEPVKRKSHSGHNKSINNNILKEKAGSEDNIKTHRRRSKEAVTKVTLKIGGEVISKVFCKTKYLNNCRTKKRKLPRVHQPESCHDCDEIKEILHSNSNIRMDESLPCPEEQSSVNECDRIARIRKIATALVEYELQQKILESSRSDDDDSEDVFLLSQDDEGDAVVPSVTSLSNINTFADDDIQEVLHNTRNDCSIMNEPINHKSTSTPSGEKSQAPSRKCDIITIDDDYCEDFEDDCMIIDERLSDRIGLKEAEESYSFTILKETDNISTKCLNDENSAVIVESGRPIPVELCDTGNQRKKRRLNGSLSTLNHLNNNYVSEYWEKDQMENQEPTIKLSQFAVPFHLITL